VEQLRVELKVADGRLVVDDGTFGDLDAYYLGTQWLQSFAERTPIHWWLFPLALAAVSAITLATVCIQGWRAATENPVNSIKTE
jgi:hypothetical protein